MTRPQLERRRAARRPAAYRVVLRGRRGRLIARGRTVNISPGGVFVLVRPRGPMPRNDRLEIELTLPRAQSGPPSRPRSRRARHRCRVVRTERVGEMVGLALELLEKLD